MARLCIVVTFLVTSVIALTGCAGTYFSFGIGSEKDLRTPLENAAQAGDLSRSGGCLPPERTRTTAAGSSVLL
ncbi:MAG TPA: hypothetical protein VEX68_18380 [Bryobacteraceae bacterium]|nr:hypothetical protein [Bryobacteraceae bacterium]